VIEDYIKKSIQLEKLDCCIISFGGCGTHYLANNLKNKKLNIRTNIWINYLCHYSNVIELPIPIIYLYRDIREAFISQLRNNFANKNYKMLNTISKRKYSDENFFIAMYEQFEKFILADNIYKIEYNELFNKDKMTNLYQFLKIKDYSFKSLFSEPKTFNFNNYQNIFDKHKDKIDYVNYFVLKAKDTLLDLDKEGATKWVK
jgi:hypothetical protein